MRTTTAAPPRFPGRSAAILAGGKSSRMGTNKALLDVRGNAMIRRAAGLLRPLVDDLFLIADDPGPYLDLNLPVFPDILPGRGPLGGIHAAIARASHPLVLCAACDMPHILPGVLELLLTGAVPGIDAVVPRPGGRPEALLAVYGRSALPAIERAVAARRLKVMRALEGLRVRYLEEGELLALDPGLCSFTNVNTPADLAAARAFAGRGRP